MPWLWKAGMIVLVAGLLASMAIGVVRLSTTPTEILGDGFRGRPAEPLRGVNDEAQSRR
jgi:hypothetical protein